MELMHSEKEFGNNKENLTERKAPNRGAIGVIGEVGLAIGEVGLFKGVGSGGTSTEGGRGSNW